MQTVWQFLSYFGDIAYWLGFTISFFLVYPFLDKKDKKKVSWVGKILIPSILLTYFIVFNLKLAFRVPRVCRGFSYCPLDYGFPSGHSAIVFAFASIVAIHFRDLKIYLPAFLLAFLVSISRVALNLHTYADIIAGAILGITTAYFSSLFYHKVLVEKSVDKLLLRKLVHLSAILLILLYFYVGKTHAILTMLFLILTYSTSEILRLRNFHLPLVNDLTLYCASEEELSSFVFKPFLFILALLLLSFFPQRMFIFGSISLIIGDGFAGLVGGKIGKWRILYNKRKCWEGFIACLVSSFICFTLFTTIQKSIFLAFLTASLESLLGKTENLALPLSVALISYFIS